MGIFHIGSSKIFNSQTFIYKLTSPSSEVYMRVDSTPYDNDARYIVIVKICSFFNYFANQDREVCNFSNAQFCNKYNDAIEGFSSGEENPVPIPEVSSYFEKNEIRKFFGKSIITEKLKVRFTNGITRSKWLFDNEFDFYPIEADKESSEILYKEFGMEGTDILTVKELLS